MNRSVSSFLKERVDIVSDSPSNRIKKSALFDDYTDYCANTKKKILNKREFYQNLNLEGFSTIKSDGKECFRGMRFKEKELVNEMQIASNIWDQADLISLMKKDYDKAVTERDEAKRDADQYCQMVDKCEKEIEELKDKLLIAEKENNALKEEKIQLGKMQLKTVDFDKEIDSLQKRIAQYNAEINAVSAEVNEFRKDVSVLITGVSQLQEKKKKLECVMSDLVGCSKRLMNMK